MFRIFYTLLLTSLFPLQHIHAQKQALCGFDSIHQKMLLENEAYRNQIESMNVQWSEYAKIKENAQNRIVIENGDTILEIPVVIHVIHTGGVIGTNYNRPDLELEQWIAFLNQVFDGTYPPFAGSGTSALPIRFVLAQRDPDCNPTNGIVRIDAGANSTYVNSGLASSGGTGLTVQQLTSMSQWPPNEYYNMYVVNKINGEDGYTTTGSFVAGFALLGASFLPPDMDGAYMLSYTAEPGNITLPHELGHAFGLYHTFEGSGPGCPTNVDCTTDGDMVCDTEPGESLLSIPCPGPTTLNPCTSQPYGTNGVQHNLMNYTNCQANHFTPGQADRMMFMAQTYRYELINSLGALPPPATTASPDSTTCIPPSITNPINGNMGPCLVHLDSIYSNTLGYNTGLGSEFYIDYTTNCNGNFHTTLTAGQTYPLSISINDNSQYIKAFIDYNNDGDFNDTGETIMDQTSSVPDTYTVMVTPPATAVQSTPLRMRVIADFSTITDPCGSLDYGQAEDFAVTIVPDNPLPLGLLYFNGKTNAQHALLNWGINTNMQVFLFELERSRDGRSFKKIATIPAASGDNKFAYTDAIEADGEYYYRLKIKTTAGETEYSPIIQLSFYTLQNAPVEIHPNPVQNRLNFQSTGIITRIKIMSASGQLLQEANPNQRQYTIRMEGLPSGLYLIQVIQENGKVIQRKIIKK